MPRTSAGLLMYRRTPDLRVFLVHPGGPFYVNKDAGVWGIPKGEPAEGEDPLATALREWAEETGWSFEECRRGDPFPLGEVKQKGGKIVHCWGFEGEAPDRPLVSNTCRVEWPRGRWLTIPEVDRGELFDVETARAKINPAQAAFLDRLTEKLS
jgi:predicted NUDIX family NTP pyrophosphohydrolase